MRPGSAMPASVAVFFSLLSLAADARGVCVCVCECVRRVCAWLVRREHVRREHGSGAWSAKRPAAAAA